MKKLFALLVIALLFVSTAAYAQWTTIYQSSFESPTYTLGQLTTTKAVAGQDNWYVDATPANAVVAADGTGNQFLSLMNNGSNNTYRALPKAYAGGHVKLSYSWAMTSAGTNSLDTAQNMWVIVNDSSNNGSNRLGTLNTTYDSASGIGSFYALTNNGTTWQSFGSFGLNEVHQIVMDINLDTRTYCVSLDGTEYITNIGAASSGTSKTASFIHFRKRYATGNFVVDNVKVEVTPEPSSMLALLCGGLGMAGMVIRRKK